MKKIIRDLIKKINLDRKQIKKNVEGQNERKKNKKKQLKEWGSKLNEKNK
jgi:hypothetical protein